MAKSMFTRKSVREMVGAAASRGGLKRSLGFLNLTSLGVGAIIGAGAFVLTGQAAAENAGPAVSISFILAAIICVFAALCYAEFAALIPVSGSAYSYAYATMGEIVAWTMGWTLTLEYLFSSCTVAVGWSGYLASFLKDLGINMPKAISESPLAYDAIDGWVATGAFLNVPAMAIMGVMGGLIAFGVKAAARFNNIMVIVKLGIVILFIGAGITAIDPSKWTPFIPENLGFFGSLGWSGILRGAGVVFFAYIGFDALSTLAQEAKNPKRDLPLSMMSSLGVSALVYVAMALVLTGLVAYPKLAVSYPLALGVDAMGSSFIWLRFVLKIAILAGLSSVVLVMMIGQSRVVYAMASDGLYPKAFAKVHKKWNTPYIATLVVTAFGMLVSGLFPIGMLGQLVSMGTLLVFAIVCFGILILRATQPLLHRPFKVPFAPWVPLAGALACLAQMVLLPFVIWTQLFIWLFIGYIIYFRYSQYHSKVRGVKKSA